MDIKFEINDHILKKEKYEYLLSLGYGEKAACVMAFFDYGEMDTACLAAIFPRENRLDRIYDWLVELPVFTYSDSRKYIKEHFSDLPERIRKEAEPLLLPDRNPQMGYVQAGAGGAVFGGNPIAMMAGGAMLSGEL